jgi:quercetin dioxygenase-like cupin family protein
MLQRAIKIAVLLLITVSTVLVAGAQDSSREPPELISQANFPDISMSFTFVKLVIDLEPGAAFPLHHHGGPTLALVLEGEITLQQDNRQTVYTAGDSWTETPANVHSAFNATDTTTRVLATFVLPAGAEATLPEQDAELPEIGPAITSRAVFSNLMMDGRFSEIERVLEFEPGETMPPHIHGGPVLVLVLDGELTVREDGEERVYEADESWIEMPGDIHEVINNSDMPAQVAATFLLPLGAPTTVYQGSFVTSDTVSH